MTIKNTLKRAKDIFRPDKNENLLLIESVFLALFIYYDILIQFPVIQNTNVYLTVLLICYISLLIAYYIFEKKKISDLGFQNRFFIFTQVIFSIFFGIITCAVFLALNTNEWLLYITCTLPLGFLIVIALFQKILLFKVEKFLKRYILKDEIWEKLDELTKKDFLQAESSMRAENVSNAIINICKGLEREIKLAIFQPFRQEVQKLMNQYDFFEILEPFKSDGSDPRERTYYNFKNYIERNRHLTFGNIPFFLLNLTDKKIGNHTILFTRFSEYLKDRFRENYNNVIEISKTLFNHNYFTITGIKISDLRNEAAHPQKDISDNGSATSVMRKRSNEILSTENYIKLLKVLAVKPNLLKLIIDLKP